MGVLNVTPDSFSDGGRYLDEDAAVEKGLALAAAGADILDVGGESTRPGAQPVPADEEIRRVVPVIRRLAAEGLVVSVDTYKASTAAAGLEAGATIVNDVGGAGRLDPELPAAAAAGGAALVIMHSRSTPEEMQVGVEDAYDDVVYDVRAFLAEAVERAVSAGVAEEAIAVDPGIGFGKTLEHNLALLRAADRLAPPGRPLVIGTSRKSMFGGLLGRPVGERLAGSVASVAACVMKGVEVVRAHDVAETRDASRVAEALR